MKTLLTPQLLGFLIERGFTYCLSKAFVNTDGHTVEIILTPLKTKPRPENITGYDTCYKITREPVQMAIGMDQTVIYVSLDFRGDEIKNRETNSLDQIFIP